jgi:hypothetical protein
VPSKDGVGLEVKILNNDLPTMKVMEGQVSQAETRCYLEDGIGVAVMMNKWSIACKECMICHEDCELRSMQRCD